MQSADMATQLKQWSKNEVCTVVQFLNARNVPEKEIHYQLMEVHSEDVMSSQSVAKCCGKL
jgi:hypothetical protein